MTGARVDEMRVATPRQRLSSRALLIRDHEVLLAQIGSGGYGVPGSWTLPGGGVDHGEHPAAGLQRELVEETGLEVELGDVVAVFSERYPRIASDGTEEDHHGVHLVYTATVAPDAGPPHVIEVGGTTVAVAWAPIDDVTAGRLPVAGVVSYVLDSLEG